jgi:nitrite reductase (NO-forming)
MRCIRMLLASLALFGAACGGDASSATGSAARGGHDRHDENSAIADGARTITVTAEALRFEPPRIRAVAGEELAIELTAVDGEHDFVIDELDAHIGAEAGKTATGGFNAGDESRTYTYYCSVPGHRDAGMEGELIVE